MQDEKQTPRYRDAVITIDEEGPSGNAFAILAEARAALKDAGARPEEIRVFVDDATSADFPHLLAVTKEWVYVS